MARPLRRMQNAVLHFLAALYRARIFLRVGIVIVSKRTARVKRDYPDPKPKFYPGTAQKLSLRSIQEVSNMADLKATLCGDLPKNEFVDQEGVFAVSDILAVGVAHHGAI